MTDEPKPATEDAKPTPAAPAALTAATETPAAAPTPDTVVGIATDGAYALVVAQFPDLAQAQAAYAELQELERTTSLKIDGVVIATADANGKVQVAKATDHSTKTGLKWGVVGGIVLGVVFPPSILASAATMGVLGGAIGKIRNLAHRGDIADELSGVMEPNTAGIIALVEDEAVVEIEKALVKADRIVSKAVDKQVAAEIDREARAAKESLATS